MPFVNIFEAKTNLSKLIETIENGHEQEIIIARNGKPVARLLPIAKPSVEKRMGVARNQFKVPANIDTDNELIKQLFIPNLN